mgnify:CR=1 FL=1
MPAIETQLIPAIELANGEAASIRKKAVGFVVNLASLELKKPPESLIVRPVRPASDLDYTTEDWGEVTGATINAYETMTTGTMGSDRYLCIYGIKVAEPLTCSLIRFTVGGGQRAIWNLQNLIANEIGDLVGYTPFPIVIKPTIAYTIERYVRQTRNVANIVLMALIVEPRGLVITP